VICIFKISLGPFLMINRISINILHSYCFIYTILLFLRLCHFKTREDRLEFLERHKGWAMTLGFNNGVHHESFCMLISSDD
jgi:hypothetical protein